MCGPLYFSVCFELALVVRCWIKEMNGNVYYIEMSGVPVMAQQKRIQRASLRMRVWSLASLVGQWSGVATSSGVGCRRGLDLVLLWLWHRLEATTQIGPLAWEPPYATGAALKRPKNNKVLVAIKIITHFLSFVFRHYFCWICDLSTSALNVAH